MCLRTIVINLSEYEMHQIKQNSGSIYNLVLITFKQYLMIYFKCVAHKHK